MRKIPICQNHLPEFYESLKSGNLAEIKKIEHELSPEEECVACSYLFKTDGKVKDALEQFLEKEGFDVSPEANPGLPGRIFFYGTRLLLLSVISVIIFFLELFLRQIILRNNNAGISFLSIIDYVIIGIVSIMIFLLIDDLFD